MQKKSFLKIYGLIPFLLIAFINAFVDLGHKIIIQNTIYKAYEGSEQLFLNAIVNALILLPFILMLSPSGFLADKYPKNIVMKISAIFNVILTLIICICYYSGAFWMAFIFTFIMGAQAAIYSPSKYGFIKELVGKDFLAMGNGVINAVSIVAILAGMALFSLSFESLYSSMYNQTDEILKEVAPLGIVLILFSCIEVFFAWRLPKLKQTNKDLVFNKKDYIRGKLLINNLKLVFKNKTIWLCIIGISFFWAISQLYLVSFPVFAKNELFIENTFYVQISLAFSGIGVILGSLVAGKFSKNYIELGFIPLGALGMFLMAFLMPYFISLLSYSFLFFFFGFCGALFIIPLLGRVFCSWVCPVNLITDFAAFVRNKLTLNNKFLILPKNLRYFVLVLVLVLSFVFSLPVFESFSYIGMIHRGIIFATSSWIFVAFILFCIDTFLSPRAICSHFCPLGAFYAFISRFALLKIKHDSDKCTKCYECRHIEFVKTMFLKMWQKGDIYKDCISCESFFTQSQLINDCSCPDCGKQTRILKEESYFFKLSKYQDKILQWYEEKDPILPKNKKNELINFVQSGLKDLSITRTSFDWGIKLPQEINDDKHIIYVWLDALFIYISSLDFQSKGENAKFWPAHVHLVGKDILRFHAIYWPAFLMSVDLPLPKFIGAHGWWTKEGEKMSKSKGNVVKPKEVVDIYGSEAFRYFLLREVPFGNDGDFSENMLINRINAELSNEFGNLLNRIIGMESSSIKEL